MRLEFSPCKILRNLKGSIRLSYHSWTFVHACISRLFLRRTFSKSIQVSNRCWDILHGGARGTLLIMAVRTQRSLAFVAIRPLFFDHQVKVTSKLPLVHYSMPSHEMEIG